MRYPNIRYGNPTELQYYAQGIPLKDLCRMLRRSEKSVASWMNGTRKVPFWVPELLRLRHMEAQMKFRQMGIADYRHRFGLAAGNIIDFKTVPKSSETYKNDINHTTADWGSAELRKRYI